MTLQNCFFLYCQQKREFTIISATQKSICVSDALRGDVLHVFHGRTAAVNGCVTAHVTPRALSPIKDRYPVGSPSFIDLISRYQLTAEQKNEHNHSSFESS